MDIPICHRIDHEYRESRLDWKFVAELVSEVSVYNLGHPQKVQYYMTSGHRSAKSLIKTLNKICPRTLPCL